MIFKIPYPEKYIVRWGGGGGVSLLWCSCCNFLFYNARPTECRAYLNESCLVFFFFFCKMCCPPSSSCSAMKITALPPPLHTHWHIITTLTEVFISKSRFLWLLKKRGAECRRGRTAVSQWAHPGQMPSCFFKAESYLQKFQCPQTQHWKRGHTKNTEMMYFHLNKWILAP